MKVDIYWISQIPAGSLAIMPRPRSGDWLEDELHAWRTAGVSVIVSLLTKFELFELGLQNERDVWSVFGLEFMSFPIEDRQIPSSAASTHQLVDGIVARLQAGEGVAIHCRMGVGRSAMIAACVMMRFGHAADDAFELIRAARGIEVPDTDEQRRWVAGFR